MKGVTVRVGSAGKLVDCQTDILSLQLGDQCLLQEGDSLYHVEVVAYLSSRVAPCDIKKLPNISRIMDEEDFAVVKKNKKECIDKKAIIQQEIEKRKLNMKLVDVEYAFDRSQIICYFRAEKRVDFRGLVFKLSRIFRLRIELRQIGAREYARLVGGIGVCGRQLCCSSHLRKFHSVSIKMAREQNVRVVPDNVSGVCGKLLCCLSYEYNQYQKLLKNVYHKGTLVETSQGVGVVVDVFLLKQQLKVQLSSTKKEIICDISDILNVLRVKPLVKEEKEIVL